MVSHFNLFRLDLCRGSLAGMAVAVALALIGGPARAESLKEDTSLGFVPADVSFYSSLQRGGEIGQKIADSNAYQRIRNSSLVQFGLMMLQMQAADPDNPLAQTQSELNKPQNQELLALLCEMFSHETFCYGDRQWAGFLETYYEIYGQVYQSLQDPEMARRMAEDEDVAAIELLGDVIDRLPDLKLPATVIGFKVQDTERAAGQLQRLENELRPLLNMVPELDGALKRRKIGDDEHLVLTLTGKMVPWDEVRAGFESDAERSDRDRELFQRLQEELESRQLMITFGLRGEYLLLTFGPNLRHLKQLGQGELLVDSPELEPVRQLADKPLVGVGYASQELMKHVGFGKSTVDMWVQAGRTAAYGAAAEGNLDEKLLEKILADLDQAGEDLLQMVPEAGAVVDVSFLTERGLEGYVHQQGETTLLDGSQQLSLLNHVGGSPVFFTVCRSHWLEQNYDVITKWVDRLKDYGQLVAAAELDEEGQAHYRKAMNAFWPLLERIDRINREYLLPAFADGQGALVLDAQATSNRWCDEMAPSALPLPLPEVAIVCGVSDPERLKQGVQQLIDVLNAGLDEAHKLYPDEVPSIDVPYPDEQVIDAGSMYSYPLPASADVDQRILPNAGLSQKVAVLAVTPEHTKRLLATSSPPAEGPLANVDRPLAAATYLNWAGLMDAISPWIEYASGLENYEAGDADGDEVVVPDPGAASTVQSVMEVLKCFHCYASTTAVQDGVTVTHYEMHFRDLPEASE
jgi:hypothetical protein